MCKYVYINVCNIESCSINPNTLLGQAVTEVHNSNEFSALPTNSAEPIFLYPEDKKSLREF